MYVDKDSTGRFAIMDLKQEELEVIHTALVWYKTGIVTSTLSTESSRISEHETQYRQVVKILRIIERE